VVIDIGDAGHHRIGRRVTGRYGSDASDEVGMNQG
jgi:hypothetical protein